MKDIYTIDLQLFANNPNTNVTTDSGLSVENKTFYDMRLIEMAQAELVHDQFGQKQPIPEGSGKKIEFRKYDPLPKATTPLTEGVTPQGQKLTLGELTDEERQILLAGCLMNYYKIKNNR